MNFSISALDPRPYSFSGGVLLSQLSPFLCYFFFFPFCWIYAKSISLIWIKTSVSFQLLPSPFFLGKSQLSQSVQFSLPHLPTHFSTHCNLTSVPTAPLKPFLQRSPTTSLFLNPVDFFRPIFWIIHQPSNTFLPWLLRHHVLPLTILPSAQFISIN